MSDEISEIKYVDFEISVRQEAADEYVVRAKSGRGKAEIRFANPFNEDKRKVVRSTLTAAALRSSSAKSKMRGAAAPEVREMKAFGNLLFQEAVSGPVREFYQKCQSQADREGAGMRLRLTLDPSVEDLPWEFLCLNDDFMALNPRSPVVRYIEGAAACSLVKVEYPLRVLVVIAKPADEVPLDTDAEKESITAALKPLTDQGVVHLSFIEGNNTWGKLMDALLPNRTNILHFIGHGDFDETSNEGVLIMADEDGKTEVVDSERLRVLVQGRSRLALILLNSCLGTLGGDAQPFSSVAAGLVKSGIPAVIAMQFEISDDAAREISETFYTSLSLNMPVDAALTEARRRIFLSNRNSLEWATPILFMQVKDGQLFEFKGTRPRTGSTTQPVKPAFETNAAKRYAEGEAAMERGEWAAAVIAYRGAMVYVPNYRDAGEKLSICASRSNAATLFAKAQKATAAKDYGHALQALSEAIKLDPTLEVSELRETVECGEKYQRAISALKRNNRGAGVDLLREVVGVRADFEDAARRLEDLAAGGNGLLGQAPSDAMVPGETPGTPEEQAGWKDRLNQLKTWITATPEVQYQPAPGTEPADPASDRDVFDKGRELWKGWFGAKNPSGPPTETPQPKPAPPVNPPAQTPPSPPPAQKRAAPPLVTPPQPRPETPPPTPKPPPTPTAKTKQPRASAQTPPPRVVESRIYQTMLVPRFVADTIRQYFLSQHCESQVLEERVVWIIQGKKSALRQMAHQGLAATIVLERFGPSLRVSIGGGAWIEQGRPFAASANVPASLITGPIGMENQEALINILWGIVEGLVRQSLGFRVS
ncbi:MAG TPA: CHAT domain-containing protein [Pyrinomonadaceae bacterium]